MKPFRTKRVGSPRKAQETTHIHQKIKKEVSFLENLKKGKKESDK